MALSNFDRRRVNGPEESFPPIFASDESDKSSQWKIGQPRSKRGPLDIRPIFLQPGLISQANGSAYIETERTKIACAIYGPRQSKNVAYSEKGRLNVEVKFTPFSCRRRRAPLRVSLGSILEYFKGSGPRHQDAEDRTIAMAVQQAIVSSVRLELLPKATIDILITVIEADGMEGVISSASIAVSTALADAGIEILGLVVACSASVMGSDIWLDPTEDEAAVSQGTLILSCIPALGTITSVWQNGKIPPGEAVNAMETCQNREEYVALRSPLRNHSSSSPRHSSHDSEESLRALELEEGPATTLAQGSSRTRSYSVSGFNFQDDLLPLTASVTEPVISRGHGLGLVNGIALCVGLQIGSGIFSSPGVVVANTQSVGASMMVWLISGLLAWTGASSYAELGSAIPQNGGAQAYLSYAYGPLVSFLFSWTAIIALKPGGNAVIALIFAEYMNRLFLNHREDMSPDDIPQWAIKLTAAGAVLLVTFLCVATRKLGTRVTIVFTVAKISALIFVMTLGVIQLARGKAAASFRQPWFEGASHSPSAYSLALYSGLWSFDGWDQHTFEYGDCHVANVSYFVVLDRDLVGSSNTVALDFGRALFGPIGGTIFAIMVVISCFGALNVHPSGSFLTSSHLVCAAGREGFLPSMFGRLHSSRKTPLNASLLQATIMIIFIAIGGGFRSLINFAVVASWAFYFLTVMGLIILRFKEPLLERTWITTPLIFCAVALFLLCMPVIAAPFEAMAVCGFVLTGIPVYYLTQRREDGPALVLRVTFDMAEHTYKFDVKMTCGGCSGAITRVLNKAKESGDVNAFTVSLETQEVVVKSSSLDYETVREKIAKTGKEIRSGVTVE
ncbi:hypothetical protein NP233_g8392 [Leucocoprinus birnbaumii]|uniref:HMA domain-containing protein n=1 Tax=Leucocoprinus birnbaumii TaxID=56174 RepID=A0AAD5VME1_9AGAR|nr:hypothetical protein NP233_g8392 [Leucocoprinus birnbaumii]